MVVAALTVSYSLRVPVPGVCFRKSGQFVPNVLGIPLILSSQRVRSYAGYLGALGSPSLWSSQWNAIRANVRPHPIVVLRVASTVRQRA